MEGVASRSLQNESPSQGSVVTGKGRRQSCFAHPGDDGAHNRQRGSRIKKRSKADVGEGDREPRSVCKKREEKSVGVGTTPSSDCSAKKSGWPGVESTAAAVPEPKRGDGRDGRMVDWRRWRCNPKSQGITKNEAFLLTRNRWDNRY